MKAAAGGRGASTTETVRRFERSHGAEERYQQRYQTGA
jgi:hypothetical protein